MVDFLEEIDGAVALRNLTVLEDIQSACQRVTYYRSDQFGRILTIDGELQHVEAWSYIYHEMIIHLPICFINNIRKILILGGGDLFAAQEALKYNSVVKVDLVDHDSTVVELTLRCYPELREVIADKRLEIHENDAVEWILINKNSYDLIVNDCFDLVEMENIRPGLYDAIRSGLSTTGVCSDLIYRHIMDVQKTQDAIKHCMAFGKLKLSLLAIPEYPGILHFLTMWGNGQNFDTEILESINDEQYLLSENNMFSYFNPDALPFYTYVPPYIISKFIL